jgi:hypothetical protein
VVPDGEFADFHLVGDLLVRRPLANQADHLDFPAGQAVFPGQIFQVEWSLPTHLLQQDDGAGKAFPGLSSSPQKAPAERRRSV